MKKPWSPLPGIAFAVCALVLSDPAAASDKTRAPSTTKNPAAKNAPHKASKKAPVLHEVTSKPQATNTTKAEETLTVTGTRIRRAGAVSDSPVTSLGSDEIRWRGMADLNNAMNQMTMVAPNMDRKTSLIHSGVESVNLRNLGAGRTLTLLDGVRMANDLTGLPGALVERVDILTGGASAVYGSDAVAGVVNTVLKHNFQGVQFDGEFDGQEHRNDNDLLRNTMMANGYKPAPGTVFGGQQWYGNLAVGRNFDHDRGNISLFGSYKRTMPMQANRLDQTGCVYNTGSGTAGDLSNNILNCQPTTHYRHGLISPASDDDTVVEPMYTLPASGQRTLVTAKDSDQEVQQTQSLITRSEKIASAGSTFHYDIVPDRLILSGLALWSRSDEVGSEPVGSGSPFAATVDMPCNNPYMSATQGQTLCGSDYGNANATRSLYVEQYPEGMRYSYHTRIDNYNAHVGLQGRLFDDIHYNFGFVRWEHDTQFSDFNMSQDNTFANSIAVTNLNGVPTCVAAIDGTDPSCKPMDIFSATNPNSAAWSYVNQSGSSNQISREYVYTFTLTGSLKKYGIKSPFARQGVYFAGTLERRNHTEAVNGITGYDTTFMNPYSGSEQISEMGAELSIPLVQAKPAIKDLSVDIGGRTGEYSLYSKNVSTWKVGFDWSPTSDITFRGSFNRSIRVPIQEALAAQVARPNTFLDLCAPPGADATVTRYTYAQCAFSGMTQQQYNALTNGSSSLCEANGYCQGNYLSGGNLALKPERATSVTLGTIITPRIIPHLRLTVDYYRVKIVNAFETLDAWSSFTQCYDKHISAYCSVYHRDPTTGALAGSGYVDGRYTNAGYQLTQGLDFAINYHVMLPKLTIFGLDQEMGGLGFGYNSTYVMRQQTQDVSGVPSYHCQGLFGGLCGQGQPTYRHTARITWEMPWAGAALTLNWRYVAGMQNSVFSGQSRLAAGTGIDTSIYSTFGHVHSGNYFDLGFGAPIGKNWSVRANVQNIFDTNPPFVSYFYSGSSLGTLSGYYDALGRTVTMNVSAKY